jgi:RimJ/RimL family protein N-acetyltransferase
VRLVERFVREHTGAREIHIVVDGENEASLRVARSVGAVERDRFVNHQGRTMVRHVISLR